MRTAVYVHAGEPPFERKRWLRNATGVEYNFALMDHGQFSFRLPRNDTPVIKGDLIVIEADNGTPPFAGAVDLLEGDDGAAVRASGREWAAVLGERVTAQERTFPVGSSGTIARLLLSIVNADNPTGINIIPTGASEPILAPYSSRGETLIEAFAALSQLSGWEWEVRYTAGRAVRADWFWRRRVGRDARQTVRVRNVAKYDYRDDVTTDYQLIQAVASLGAFGARPSVAASTAFAGTSRDLAQTRAAVRLDPTRRSVQRRNPFTAREKAVLLPLLPNGLAVQQQAVQELLGTIGGSETLHVVAAGNDWTNYRVGNIVTVEIPESRFGQGLVRPFRIHGVEPSHETGLCALAGKVLP